MKELDLSTGKYRIRTLVTDRFRLDGGAMFGSVPKTLWSRLIPADERNRIQLACRSLIISDEKNTILVDCGMGRKWNEKEREIYAIEAALDGELNQHLTPTSIVLTHLHFDHCGWISTPTDSGELALTFPNTPIYVSKRNLEHALKPGPRERASYLRNNIDPIIASHPHLTEDGEEIFPGISVHQVHGHTWGLQYVKIKDEQATIVFPSDLMPTSSHIQIPYVMGYDICAESSMREKEQFVKSAIQENWLIVFEHDAQFAAGYAETDAQGKFVFKPYQQ